MIVVLIHDQPTDNPKTNNSFKNAVVVYSGYLYIWLLGTELNIQMENYCTKILCLGCTIYFCKQKEQLIS